MPSKKTRHNPLGLAPAELQLAEYHRIKRGNAKGGRNAWKGKDAAERSAIAKARAAKRLGK